MDYLREIKKTCSRLGVGYAAFLLVGLMVQAEAGLILGVLDKMGWKEYVDRAPGLDSHVFVRNAGMLAHCERHENAVQAAEAAVRRGAAGGCFFCLHQHYVHRKYYRNRPHEHREWNPGQASLKSGK